tara:strand:+ start:799 stop:1272 length:474 start_codon:yes stop_codon:yes gene_type:complete
MASFLVIIIPLFFAIILTAAKLSWVALAFALLPIPLFYSLVAFTKFSNKIDHLNLQETEHEAKELLHALDERDHRSALSKTIQGEKGYGTSPSLLYQGENIQIEDEEASAEGEEEDEETAEDEEVEEEEKGRNSHVSVRFEGDESEKEIRDENLKIE